MGFPVGSVVKNLLANAGAIGDVGSIAGLGISLGGGNGTLLQYSCLENPMDRRAWKAIEKPVCMSRNNSHNWTWNNSLVQNWESTTSRLYIITLLI